MINARFLDRGSAGNIRLYPWLQLTGNLIFWMPVFFLFFASRLSLSEVILLEAIYYAGVVVFEVPHPAIFRIELVVVTFYSGPQSPGWQLVYCFVLHKASSCLLLPNY